MNYKRKYRKGERVTSLDELVKQDFIYWRDKVVHQGWFMSWQLRMAHQCVGEKGVIYYAIRVEEEK